MNQNLVNNDIFSQSCRWAENNCERKIYLHVFFSILWNQKTSVWSPWEKKEIYSCCWTLWGLTGFLARVKNVIKQKDPEKMKKRQQQLSLINRNLWLHNFLLRFFTISTHAFRLTFFSPFEKFFRLKNERNQWKGLRLCIQERIGCGCN